MKTKITLILVTFLILSSCIKDYHGHGPKEIEFTPTNFIYEGDMFSFYLNGEIESLTETIDKLKKISPNDQGYDQAKKDIIVAESEQKDLQGQIVGIIDLSSVGFTIGPDWPRPPCNCYPLGLSVGHLLAVPDNTTTIKSVSIQNTDGKVISKVIAEFSPLPEYNNQILSQSFRVYGGITGEIKINVEKVDEYGKLVGYTINAYVYPKL